MLLIFSSAILTVLLLVGAFVDFLATPSLRRQVAHDDHFADAPQRKRTAAAEPEPAAQYDRAA
ncbi:MAG TPA: hypothetical protein VHW25_10025 [Steroidobacteraceae bacterium]|jgi:hypothetical protein|nr:hypothetical protein [Steroidobacteraceae bacterium]